MKIFVDADSCPKPARDLALRTALRRNIGIIFAANRLIPGINGSGVVMELCSTDEGAADDRIVALARPGDLALTRDVPLAARLVAANVAVLDDRGRVYTAENIRERLSLRIFMVNLAETGLKGERFPSYGRKDLKNFADSLDRILTRLTRNS
ncbi:MAG: DUF188 domain-containing protein [Treponema sp.]|nr:DUF188 domain-containing protein [Treponema sp.]